MAVFELKVEENNMSEEDLLLFMIDGMGKKVNVGGMFNNSIGPALSRASTVSRSSCRTPHGKNVLPRWCVENKLWKKWRHSFLAALGETTNLSVLAERLQAFSPQNISVEKKKTLLKHYWATPNLCCKTLGAGIPVDGNLTDTTHLKLLQHKYPSPLQASEPCHT